MARKLSGDISPGSSPSWTNAEDYVRGLDDGPIGQCGEDGNGCGDASTPGQICWSLSPFTVTDTDNGETCVNEGPLDFTTSTAYYRMQIDRTTIEPRYCQIAMVTDSAVPGVGDTYVVALADENDSGTPTSVPTMPIYLLMVLSGLLALFGFYRVRASK